MKRKRRHRINKVLQILGYITESIGNIIPLIAVFVMKSNSSLHLGLVSLFLFFFAIPIPLSHSMPESRVKDTIITAGWVEGSSDWNKKKSLMPLLRKRNSTKTINVNRIIEASYQQGANEYGQQTITLEANQQAMMLWHHREKMTIAQLTELK